MTRFLNYSQAAEYLALPIGTLRAMVHRKSIPHVRIGPRTVTFELADLDRWIAAREQRQAMAVDDLGQSRQASPQHEAAIGRLAPNAERRGFAERVRDATGVETVPGWLIPDAFDVDRDDRAVTMYEVEHTNPLGDRKLARIRELRDTLHGAGWSLRLLAAGANSVEWTEIDVETGDMAVHEIYRIAVGMGRWFEAPGP